LEAKVGVVAPGVVLFSSTDTLLEFLLATTRSGLPSPLRSATATEKGFVPVAKSLWAASVTGGPTTLVTPVSCTEKVRLGLLKTPLPKIGMAMSAVADPYANVVVPVVGATPPPARLLAERDDRDDEGRVGPPPLGAASTVSVKALLPLAGVESVAVTVNVELTLLVIWTGLPVTA